VSEPIVREVATWFGENCERLVDTFTTVRFRVTESRDELRGKVNIELAQTEMAASITFWNRGDVSALLLEISSKKQFSLDDRHLTPQDVVSVLLARYLDEILHWRKE
jgi:hypothetical protein